MAWRVKVNEAGRKMNWRESPEGFLAFLAAIGAAIGLGKLLVEDKPFTLRIAVGRALVSGGLGASAGLVLAAYPDASPVLMYGLAAALASMGTSLLELAVVRFVAKEK
jgi:hypothetical protein